MNKKKLISTALSANNVTISIETYRQLIACQTMLDMIIESSKNGESSFGYTNETVVKLSAEQRERHFPILKIQTADTPDPGLPQKGISKDES